MLFLCLYVVFSVLNFVVTEDLCVKTIPLVQAKCSSYHAPFCCTGSAHDDCVASDVACNAGFYQRGNETLPCPNGYMCPRDYNCLIPCDMGTICLQSERLENTTSCRDQTNGKISDAVLIDGLPVCPGRGSTLSCPEGFYCPDPESIIACPEGKFCTGSSTMATRCNLFQSSCSSFAAADINDAIGLILLGCVIVVAMIILYARYRLQGHSIIVGYAPIKLDIPSNKKQFRKTFNLQNGLWTFSNVDIEGQRHSLPEVRHSLSLSVRDFTFTLKDGHRVLQKVTAVFPHSRLNIVMGPSGCGKSTLINALMGRSDDHGTVSGQILVNEVEIKSLRQISNYVGYVMQHDVMHENLTVKELLTYQAQLRLPKSEGKLRILDVAKMFC